MVGKFWLFNLLFNTVSHVLVIVYRLIETGSDQNTAFQGIFVSVSVRLAALYGITLDMNNL